MLLSGITLKMVIYGVLRYLLPIAPTALLRTTDKVMISLFLELFTGRLLRLYHDIKKIIASSSSLSHVGLMVAGIFASAILTHQGNFTFEGAKSFSSNFCTRY